MEAAALAGIVDARGRGSRGLMRIWELEEFRSGRWNRRRARRGRPRRELCEGGWRAWAGQNRWRRKRRCSRGVGIGGVFDVAPAQRHHSINTATDTPTLIHRASVFGVYAAPLAGRILSQPPRRCGPPNHDRDVRDERPRLASAGDCPCPVACRAGGRVVVRVSVLRRPSFPFASHHACGHVTRAVVPPSQALCPQRRLSCSCQCWPARLHSTLLLVLSLDRLWRPPPRTRRDSEL